MRVELPKISEELAEKIQRTFVFDLDVNDESINQELLPNEFLKWEIRKILSLVRFTSGGEPVNIDGYIKVSDQSYHYL
ncbi:hypothetical protein H8E77_42045 [bacterium]|nr:hypothetical protein [bacterium]